MILPDFLLRISKKVGILEDKTDIANTNEEEIHRGSEVGSPTMHGTSLTVTSTMAKSS